MLAVVGKFKTCTPERDRERHKKFINMSRFYKVEISRERDFVIIIKPDMMGIIVDGKDIYLKPGDLEKIKTAITTMENHNNNKYNPLLKKFLQIESDKDRKLLSTDKYRKKISDLGNNATREKLTEAIKEAVMTVPVRKRALIRKMLNLLLAKYNIREQKTDRLSLKANKLLKELGIDF